MFITRQARSTSLAALTLSALVWASPAYAQSEKPWSVSFDLGTQLAVAGDAHGGGNGTVLGLATNVTAKSYGDVFGSGFYWQASLGYAVRPNAEVRVTAGFTGNGADRLQVGTVAGLQLNAEFQDYQAFGMDVGYRQYFGSRPLRPFVAATVGFTRVEAIDATLTVPAAGVTLSDVPFYADSTVPSFGIGGGVQMDLSETFAIQAGADLRWHGGLEQNEGLSGTGLQGINDDSARWALPITAGVTVRF